MTKKTRLVPFHYQTYLMGAKAVFSNALTEVNETTEIISIYDNAEINDYLVIYRCASGRRSNLFVPYASLLLEQELEEKTFYVNVYGPSENYTRTCHQSEANADLNNCGRVGKLKVTYTDEDLIK